MPYRLEQARGMRWIPVDDVRKPLQTRTEIEERFADSPAQWNVGGELHAQWPRTGLHLRAMPVLVMIGRFGTRTKRRKS